VPTYTGSSNVGDCSTAVVTIAYAIPASSATTASAASHRQCQCRRGGSSREGGGATD
jgi:hypothetical protein